MTPYRRLFFYQRLAQSPRCYKIAGQVTLGGVAQQNAIVTLLDSDTDEVVGGTVLADASGNYSFDSGRAIVGHHKYHVTAEYDSGSQKYNSKSMPFITPVEN